MAETKKEPCVWYTDNGERICRVQAGVAPAGDDDWKKAPVDWGGDLNDKLEWFDGNMRRIPDSQLIAHGIRTDNRGIWFNKNNPNDKEIIDALDMDIDQNAYTKALPLNNEPYQIFDPSGNTWIVDTEKKELAEKEREAAEKRRAVEEEKQKIIDAQFENLLADADPQDVSFLRYRQLREEQAQVIAELSLMKGRFL